MSKGGRQSRTEKYYAIAYAIGGRIKDLRRSNNHTQKELATILQTTPNTISFWESGETIPAVVSILKLCDLYGVTTDWLLRGR